MSNLTEKETVIREIHLPLPSGSGLIISLTNSSDQDYAFIKELAEAAYAKICMTGSRRSALMERWDKLQKC